MVFWVASHRMLVHSSCKLTLMSLKMPVKVFTTLFRLLVNTMVLTFFMKSIIVSFMR